MRLSESSHAIFAGFFSQAGCCDAEDFPVVSVYTGFAAKMILRLTLADGITFGRFVFVDPKYVRRADSGNLVITKSLLAHELVHVLQYKDIGFLRFLIRYLREFRKEFRTKERWNARSWFEAYEAMPLESEARKRAQEFMSWYNEQKMT